MNVRNILLNEYVHWIKWTLDFTRTNEKSNRTMRTRDIWLYCTTYKYIAGCDRRKIVLCEHPAAFLYQWQTLYVYLSMCYYHVSALLNNIFVLTQIAALRAIIFLTKYQLTLIVALDIGNLWFALNLDTFLSTDRLMEKYCNTKIHLSVCRVSNLWIINTNKHEVRNAC